MHYASVDAIVGRQVLFKIVEQVLNAGNGEEFQCTSRSTEAAAGGTDVTVGGGAKENATRPSNVTVTDAQIWTWCQDVLDRTDLHKQEREQARKQKRVCLAVWLAVVMQLWCT